MSYQNQQKKCNFCGTFLSEKRKDDVTGKWIVKNLDGKPHEYRECKAIQANRPQQQFQGQPQKSIPSHSHTVNVGGSSTFSQNEEPKATGVTMYSLLIKISDTKQEVKELRKQIETLASIIDSMAQKQDLMITKIGYPEPKSAIDIQGEKVIKQLDEKLEEKYGPPSYIDKDGTKHWTYLTNDKKEIKAEQRHPTPEELANAFKPTPTQEIVNPMRTPRQEILQEQEEMSMQWETLSEAFICHNCESKTHNGYTKLGTRLCPTCKDKVESNESEDNDRSDVNNYKPRSIEDINEDI